MQPLLSVARRWVAGTESIDAIERSEEANARGIGAIINNLGEHYTKVEDAQASLREYLSVLEQIRARGLDANISVKPTQLGLTIGEEHCRRLLGEVRRRCAKI